MNSLSLFSGAGGGLLAEKYLLNWRSIGYVENNVYCQKVLAQRIEEGFLELAPLWGDIDEFIESGAVDQYKGLTDVVTGGFPCQPFSVAGRRKGKDDSRNCWPQTIEVIRRVRPRWFFGENVPGLLNSGYFPEILGSLAEAGYDARWIVLGVDDVGGNHRRKRLWLLAESHSEPRSSRQPRRAGGELSTESEGLRGGESQGKTGQESGGSSSDVADSDSINERTGEEPEQSSRDSSGELSGNSSKNVADSTDKRSEKRHAERSQQTEEGEADNALPRSKDVAHPEGEQRDVGNDDSGISMEGEQVSQSGDSSGSNPMADTLSDPERSSYWGEVGEGEQRWEDTDIHQWYEVGGNPTDFGGQWSVEPGVGRVAHGVASRVDRLKALGNGQCSLVAGVAWGILI